MTQPKYKQWKRGVMRADDPNRKIPPRMQLGNAPTPVQRPLLLALITDVADAPDDAPDNQWRLSWLRHKKDGRLDPDEAWLNCKVHVCKPDGAPAYARHKANFWVSWSLERNVLNRRVDTAAMEGMRPKLAAATIAVLGQASSWAGLWHLCPVYSVTDNVIRPHAVMTAILNLAVDHSDVLVTSAAELKACVDWVKQRQPEAKYGAKDLGLDMWRVTRMA